MSKLNYAISGIFIFAALVVLHGSAGAATNRTAAWCLTKGTADQTITSSESSSLIWSADGELVLESTNGLARKIWSSGTASVGSQLCYQSDGSLVIHDGHGAPIWSYSGAAALPFGTSSYEYRLSINGCTLASSYTFTLVGGLLRQTGELWSKSSACPVVSASVTSDGWCMDTTSEQIVVQDDSSELKWQTDGNLVLYARGIRAGTVLWSSGTSGAGQQLCFDNTGKLSIANASSATVWSLGTAGATTTSYQLGLDACDVNIRSLASTTTLASKPSTCPQSVVSRGTTAVLGTSDITLAENSDAKLVFDTGGNLVLKSVSGDVLWTTGLPSNTGYMVTFQGDSNLVIYNSAWAPVWASNTNSSGATLALDHCSFAIKDGGATYYGRGLSSCARTSIGSNWSMVASGNTRLLSTAEAHLEWQLDGNLVLYTTTGAPIWASNTNGSGNILAFQGDGNLVIYNSSWVPVWASGTNAGGTGTLQLGDGCTLTIAIGGILRWTGVNSCAVANYTYENAQGNSLFGTVMRTHVTAQDTGIARLDSTTAVDTTLFGSSHELLSATAYQTELDNGSNLTTGSVTVFGEMTAGVNVTIPAHEFFHNTRTYVVGFVPVVVTAGATGEVGLSLAATSGGVLTLTPSAGVYATVEAGVGVGDEHAGASAGIRGSLTLLDMSLPISFQIFPQNGHMNFHIQGDLDISTLGGSLALYAKAFVKVWLAEFSVEWSYTLFSWTGIEWSKTLFSKTSSF